MKVWIIEVEHEYVDEDGSFVMACTTEDLANEIAAVLNKASEQEDLQGMFYGTYSVRQQPLTATWEDARLDYASCVPKSDAQRLASTPALDATTKQRLQHLLRVD